MSVTTRPPGGDAGLPRAPATAAPAPSLRLLVEAVRALAGARSGPAAGGPLPPLPETGGESGLTRWLQAALAGTALPAAELSRLVEQAHAEALATLASGGGAARGPLDAAREALLRALAAPPPATAPAVGAPAPGPPDPAVALRGLLEEIRTGIAATLGVDPPFVAALDLGDDPGNAGAALLGWLRAAAAAAGVRPQALAAAVAAGAERALAALPPAGGESPLATRLGQARDVVLRGLEAPAGARAEPPDPRAGPAFRPDLPVGPAAAGRRAGAAGARSPGERVEPVGRDDGRRRPPQREAAAPRDGAGSGRAETLDAPMDCLRRYFEAFHGGDPAAYAAQWVYPACSWSRGRWWGYPDATACAAGFVAERAELRAAGVAGGRILMLRVEPVSEEVAIVHALATREGADGRVLAEVEAAYTTVRGADGWRVAVRIAK